ncbi:MAG: helix-turn-helix domain-containing protein [Candidatus Thorarchaeota archaeon]
MIEAILHIASENYYSCVLTKKIPVRVSLVTINGPEGFGIIETLDGTETPLKKYMKFMKKSSSIQEIEVTHKSELQYWTRAIHTIDGKSIHDTVLENGCMTRLPIIISRGIQVHTILAPSQKKFTQLYESLKKRFTTVKVARIRRYSFGSIDHILTVKQTEAVSLAHSKGYYEIPRRCEIKHIAEDAGIKRVAMQERLRRAERAIMQEFVQENNL